MNILLITCDQFRADAIENNAPKQPLGSPDTLHGFQHAGLYDLESPKGELRNRAEDPGEQERKQALREETIAWCRANGDHAMLDGGDLAASPPLDLDSLTFAAGKPGWRKY